MSKSKHNISRAKAKKLVDQFANKKKGSRCFKQIPDGFLFEADEVRKLLRHRDAKYFVIKMGLKVSTRQGSPFEELTPVLFVTDADYKPILSAATSDTEPTLMRSSDASGTDITEDGGGYLDESRPIPPPTIEL